MIEAAAVPGGALDGVTILDLTTVIMGPYATQMLGDMGADVIKIESPAGDPMRHMQPTKSPGMAALFLNTNRNKRSVALDLKQPAGRGILFRLAAQADVLIHNLRPGPLARMRLSNERLREANPRIICCGARGFGEGGPYRDKPAYDDLIQAASGMAALGGRLGPEPAYMPSILCDKVTALSIVNAVVAALFHRERSGHGQTIEVPMFETMAAFNLLEHMNGHCYDPPVGKLGWARIMSPFRKPFRSKDGHVSLIPYSDANWRAFFEFAGRPELARDPRFLSMSARVEHVDALYGLVEAIAVTKTTAEWIAFGDRSNVPAMKVIALDELWQDDHLAAVGFFEGHRHPSEGPMRIAPTPLRFSDSPVTVRRLAPRLGQHTREVLAGAGLAEDEIDRLAASGIVTTGA